MLAMLIRFKPHFFRTAPSLMAYESGFSKNENNSIKIWQLQRLRNNGNAPTIFYPCFSEQVNVACMGLSTILLLRSLVKPMCCLMRSKTSSGSNVRFL